MKSEALPKCNAIEMLISIQKAQKCFKKILSHTFLVILLVNDFLCFDYFLLLLIIKIETLNLRYL